MMWEADFTCSKCGHPYLARSWKSVDVIAEPNLRELVMSERFNLNTCPHCEHPARITRPFVLWEAHFIAVVLCQPMKPNDAVALIHALLRDTAPPRKDLPIEVLVFSRLDKLQKALADPTLTRARITISECSQRDWSAVELLMQETADALLQQDMPERAFLLYAEFIGHIPELFFKSDIRESFELIAIAAGSRVANEQADKRVALEQFRETEATLSLEFPPLPRLEPYNVCYCPIDETMETGDGFQEGDRHAVNVLNPFIQPDRVGPDELARGLLLVLGLSSLAQCWLPKPQTSIDRFQALAKAKLAIEWEALQADTQQEIEVWYQKLSGSNVYDE